MVKRVAQQGGNHLVNNYTRTSLQTLGLPLRMYYYSILMETPGFTFTPSADLKHVKWVLGKFPNANREFRPDLGEDPTLPFQEGFYDEAPYASAKGRLCHVAPESLEQYCTISELPALERVRSHTDGLEVIPGDQNSLEYAAVTKEYYQEVVKAVCNEGGTEIARQSADKLFNCLDQDVLKRLKAEGRLTDVGFDALKFDLDTGVKPALINLATTVIQELRKATEDEIIVPNLKTMTELCNGQFRP